MRGRAQKHVVDLKHASCMVGLENGSWHSETGGGLKICGWLKNYMVRVIKNEERKKNEHMIDIHLFVHGYGSNIYPVATRLTLVLVLLALKLDPWWYRKWHGFG